MLDELLDAQGLPSLCRALLYRRYNRDSMGSFDRGSYIDRFWIHVRLDEHVFDSPATSHGTTR